MQEIHLSGPAPVLNHRGAVHPGWAERGDGVYRRSAVKASAARLREWDCYQIMDGQKCLRLAFGHTGRTGAVRAVLLDYRGGEVLFDFQKRFALPFARLDMPESAEADSDLVYDAGGVYLRFLVRGDTRFLSFHTAAGISAEAALARRSPYSAVVNMPFAGAPRAFCRSQKIAGMTASAKVEAGGERYLFGGGSFALLDWERGAWPARCERLWAAGAGEAEGAPLAFSFGEGPGDTARGTENMLFYAGAYTKLGRVAFTFERADAYQPWQIEDERGRLVLTLRPCYEFAARRVPPFTDGAVRQTFGEAEGRAVLDGGRVLEFKGLAAFAELGGAH